jgi:hypothetical protein
MRRSAGRPDSVARSGRGRACHGASDSFRPQASQRPACNPGPSAMPAGACRRRSSGRKRLRIRASMIEWRAAVVQVRTGITCTAPWSGALCPHSCRTRLDKSLIYNDFLATCHSHSIINGACKPLILLYDGSNVAGFTVRCTATSHGIPSRSFHHRSTSIGDSRQVHDGQLSRSIEVYRALGDWRRLQRTSLRPAGDPPNRPGINEPKCLSCMTFLADFLP